MRKNVSSVYLVVVDDVVDKMRDTIVDGAGDDSVLSELQALEVEVDPKWSCTRSYYVNPIADILFQPTRLRTPVQTPPSVKPEPGQIQSSLLRSEQALILNPRLTRMLFKDQSIPWTNQRPQGVDVNITYKESSVGKGRNNYELHPLTEESLIVHPSKRRP